jgi:UDP-2,3-diacylglucosamine pyrophosphatase LpxH
MTKAVNKTKIDTLIISDIHLGDNNARCQELVGLLGQYDYKRLILNGDIVDGLNFQRFHSEHWDVLSYFRGLSKKCEVVWIHGNHDAAAKILSRLLGIKVYNRYIWEQGGKKFLAIHGHQFDRFMHNNIIISYLAFAFYKFLKKIDKTEILVNFAKRRKTWQRNSAGVAQGAIKFGKVLGVNYVFCGHTHQTNEVEKWGIKYFNTGSWVEKPSNYVTILNEKIDLLSL